MPQPPASLLPDDCTASQLSPLLRPHRQGKQLCGRIMHIGQYVEQGGKRGHGYIRTGYLPTNLRSLPSGSTKYQSSHVLKPCWKSAPVNRQFSALSSPDVDPELCIFACEARYGVGEKSGRGRGGVDGANGEGPKGKPEWQSYLTDTVTPGFDLISSSHRCRGSFTHTARTSG